MAHFQTGYFQKEQVLDVKVASALKVGDLVKMTTNGMDKATSKDDAQYIVAQSDMTMEYGHVPVERGNWAYSDDVAVTTGNNTKKVAVYYIYDKSDVIE